MNFDLALVVFMGGFITYFWVRFLVEVWNGGDDK